MNVGSILNKESPPSESEESETTHVSRVHHAPELSPSSSATSTRHSIVNILNDEGADEERPQLQPSDSDRSRFFVPVSPTTLANTTPTHSIPNGVHQAPRPIKRNSIADITNETDIDIATGKEIKPSDSESSHALDSEPTNAPTSDIDMSDIRDEDRAFPDEDDLRPTKETHEDEDELARLKKIKNSSKPRRYETPPIWAQEWIPPNQAHRYRNNDHNSDANSAPRSTVISDKRVFDYTSTPSIDLECSITGVIPPPSVTRTIAEWIFANFRDIADHNRKYVELELKFGTIMDKQRGKRINVNVTTECIFTDHTNVYFDMQVDEKAWTDISKLFQELENSYQEELKKAKGNKPKRKFNTLDEDITDSFYQVGKPGEQPKSIRVSKDNTLNPPRYTGIEKQRIADLFIHNPSSMYDLRLSLALEMPVQEGSIEPLVAKNVPVLVREKKRNTWAHAQTVTKFDLTRVLIPRESKNKLGKKVVTHDKNFEIELEIDTLELFNAIDKVLQGTDRFRYEELVEIYINNARVLNNRVTKLALP